MVRRIGDDDATAWRKGRAAQVEFPGTARRG